MSGSQHAGSGPPNSDNLGDAADALGTSLVRAGTLMVAWPLYLLPTGQRDDALAAANRLVTAVGDLHLSLVRETMRGISVAARELGRSAEPDQPSPGSPTKVVVE